MITGAWLHVDGLRMALPMRGAIPSVPSCFSETHSD